MNGVEMLVLTIFCLVINVWAKHVMFDVHEASPSLTLARG
jgi:hypothetical protein